MAVFEIGPDRCGDLRTARSYFVISLLTTEQSDKTRERLVDFMQDKQFTDVYLLSHGWHRNFFGAVAAYDRLVSRFTVLFQRGRLSPKNLPYRPLFLCMHWNSDPDEDGWIDTAGRRSKDSFLQNANALFEPMPGISEGALLDTLEDAYECMTFVSAPDVAALNNSMDDKARTLYDQAAQRCAIRGRLAEGPVATPEDKVALLWRCYEEATPQRVLLDQSEPPRRFGNPLDAIKNLFKFLIAALGLTTLLGFAPKILSLFQLTISLPQWSLTQWIEYFLLLTVTALGILGGTIAWQQTVRHGKGARGLPVLAVGSWLPLQVLLLLPLVIYLFVTFLFRTGVVLLAPLVFALGVALNLGHIWPTGLFLLGCAVFSFVAGRQKLSAWSLSRERFPQNPRAWPYGLRDVLAALARWPIRLLRLAVAADSQAGLLGDALDKQLAFWEMQRKAVRAGQAAGHFLQDLWSDLEARQSAALTTARLHLIGHSFGGLLMANAVRFLSQTPISVHSLITIQGALASAWFETEPWCRDRRVVQGALACIYSAYDMANGFYYPASNSSRMSAGYVGLCAVGNRYTQAQNLGKDGLFASLVQPPDLSGKISGAPPYLLNLDASRLIYEGSLAAGGGHEDIYKDDVIHMLWAVTVL